MLLIFGQFLSAHAQTFAGQTYTISDKLDTECSIELRCDCCVSDLIFLTETEFALIGYCEGGGTYQIGTFTILGDRLELKFKQFYVSEETGFLVEEREIKKKEQKIDPLEFKIGTCVQKADKIENSTIEEYRYGFRRTTTDSDKVILKLKESRAWKLLAG